MKKYLSTTTLMLSWLLVGANITQAQTNSIQSPIIDGSNNGSASGNAINQGNAQNSISNNQQVNYPSIPLNPVIQNPVNTENDLGVNLGAGINTLDGRNVTVYLGITYQPGRTDDHYARMARLKSETQLLESQRNVTQTQLQLLKQQVAEQEIRLQRMQTGRQAVPK